MFYVFFEQNKVSNQSRLPIGQQSLCCYRQILWKTSWTKILKQIEALLYTKPYPSDQLDWQFQDETRKQGETGENPAGCQGIWWCCHVLSNSERCRCPAFLFRKAYIELISTFSPDLCLCFILDHVLVTVACIFIKA